MAQSFEMGAEQSISSGAESDEGDKLFNAQIDKYAQEAKENILRERRERREKREAEQANIQKESPTAAAEREPGELLEGQAVERIAVPIRSTSSSQTTPKFNDVLAEWHPRKEREEKRKKSLNEQRTGDDFVGSSNRQSPQGDESNRARRPLKQPPRLDTGSDTIIVPHKPSSANPTKSAASVKTAAAVPATIPTKRPAAENHATDARRPSFSALSSMPKIPKRNSVASPQSPDGADGDGLKSVGSERPPVWYNETPFSNSRTKNDGDVDTLLNSLRTHMSKAKTLNGPQHETELTKVFTEVCNKMHIIVFQQVNPKLLKRHRMLHNADGLPHIFDPQYSQGVRWPWYTRADAEELYNRWCRKIFDTDILRGIDFSGQVKGAKEQSGASIYPDYKARWVPTAAYHGNGDLINGQWWPFQICALRDGAHGSIQGGIFGASGEGAYSCVISGGKALDGNPYPNKDDGDEVSYCGTDSDDGTITAFTQRMVESHENGQPVRLIRSHNARTLYSPEVGFRYDGLYHVVSVERLDAESSKRQRHRFKLVRELGQDPIRGGSGPEKRPTPQEIEEYWKHQRLSGKGKGQG